MTAGASRWRLSAATPEARNAAAPMPLITIDQVR
jgi:hypothetical protein